MVKLRGEENENFNALFHLLVFVERILTWTAAQISFKRPEYLLAESE